VLSTCFGMKTSVKISALAALCSTIIPTVLLIVFAAIWLLTGHHSVTPLQAHNFMPTSMHMSDWSLLGATVYMFAGLELAAYCLKYTRNAKRDYGRALLISGIIIVVLSVLGTLSIAVMVPAGKENLIAGMMQAFLVFLNAYHLHAVIYVIMALFIIGQVCVVSNYLMTLSEGLLSASKHHMLPKIFTKVNRHGSPINILMAQGAITIVISLLYFVVPDVNSAYWMIEAIVAIAGSFRYLIIFAAAFVLRFTHPKVPRSIRVPGGNWGIAMLSGAGFLIVAFAMAMTFLPPSQLKLQAIHTFYFWIISGTVLCFVLPLVVGYFSSFKHVQALEEEHNDLTHHGHH
jgi:amino acid transporter